MPTADCLARFNLTEAEWADLPAVLQQRMERKFVLEQALMVQQRERDERKATEAKDRRRRWEQRMRISRSKRTAVAYAQCGINWFSMSEWQAAHAGHWTHCHRCGKKLTYYPTHDEAYEKRGDCIYEKQKQNPTV